MKMKIRESMRKAWRYTLSSEWKKTASFATSQSKSQQSFTLDDLDQIDPAQTDPQ